MRDDRQFNTNFVRLVEKHPPLYDFRIPEYFRRDEQDKAWTAVAREVNEPTEECKSRWRVLRGSLTRHLKQRRGPKAKKPYYLYNAMKFVIPFTKTRKQSGQDTPPRMEDEYLSNLNNDITYEEDIKHEDDQLSITNWDDTRSSTPDVPKTPPKKDKMEERAIQYFSTKTEEAKRNGVNFNADLDFFRSVLPDIAQFSSKQKRQFKLGVIKLIDDILTEDETCTSSVQNNLFPESIFS